MTSPLNLFSQQKAGTRVPAFVFWVATKTNADIQNMAVRGQLSHKEIAREIGVAKSVLLLNPRIREAMIELEAEALP